MHTDSLEQAKRGSSDGSRQRKLIFYSTVGPDQDDAAWTVLSLARRAVEASLEVEVFLAGPATGLMRGDARERMSDQAKENLRLLGERRTPISLSPGCASYRGVSSTDMEQTGAAHREIAEMFGDVAEGAQIIAV